MPQPFGEWLKMMRERRGLTVAALGEKAGFSHAHISKIENGKGEPHKDAVKALAQALEVDPREALLAFIEEPSTLESSRATITLPSGNKIAAFGADGKPVALSSDAMKRIDLEIELELQNRQKAGQVGEESVFPNTNHN